MIQQRNSSVPQPFPPRAIRILGAGRFGRLAAERLGKRFPRASIRVVDQREERLKAVERDFGLPTQAEDALSHLSRGEFSDDVWIIPAVPVHVAFHWVLDRLSRSGSARMLPVPDAADSQVPNPYRVADGTLFASYATFICPDACNEPDDICTHTRQRRLGNLFEHLESIVLPGYGIVVVRSWQLAPGVGGYPAGYLAARLKVVEQTPGRYLVATSCRCHGVLNCLEWNRASSYFPDRDVSAGP